MTNKLQQAKKLTEAKKTNDTAFVLMDKLDTPKKHNTTLTESFNTADSATLGPDHTWSEETNIWSILTNQADSTGLGYAICNDALSSDDHYSYANVATWTTNRAPGCMVRWNCPTYPSYPNYYDAYYGTIYQTHYYLRKVSHVNAGVTQIDDKTISPASSFNMKVQADGSTIKTFYNGTEYSSVTDTSYTGWLKAGIWSYDGDANHVRIDNWEGGDIAVAGYTAQLIMCG